jgi:hypothetical protein
MTTSEPEGQAGLSPAERKDVNNASVLARFALLRSVISAPAEVEASVRELVGGLISQGRLAVMELPANDITKIPPTAITKMSLGTLRTRANDLESDGFRHLDALRNQARKAVATEGARSTGPARGSVADLEARVKSQAEFIQQLVDELAFLRARDLEYLGHMRHFAAEAGQLDYCLKIQNELEVKYHRPWVPLPRANGAKP